MAGGDSIKAVIIAGGKGTRLRPLTYKIPKALVPIDGKPIVEHQIDLLKRYKITDIIMCTGYKHDLIEDYFGKGSKFGVKINYLVEKRLMGTGGAMKNAEKLVDSTFIAVYGDIMFSIDLKKLIEFHRKKGALATLVLHESNHPYDSDLIKVDKKNKVIEFIGKPSRDKPLPTKLAKTSIYILEPEVFAFIPKTPNNFEKDIMPRLVSTGKVYGFITKEYAKDIGTFDRLDQANKSLSKKVKRA